MCISRRVWIFIISFPGDLPYREPLQSRPNQGLERGTDTGPLLMLTVYHKQQPSCQSQDSIPSIMSRVGDAIKNSEPRMKPSLKQSAVFISGDILNHDPRSVDVSSNSYSTEPLKTVGSGDSITDWFISVGKLVRTGMHQPSIFHSVIV
jgi:hypothetical protein